MPEAERQKEPVMSQVEMPPGFSRTPYAGSQLQQMYLNQRSRGESFTALLTDLDDSLHRPDRQTATDALAQAAADRDYPIIGVTSGWIDYVQRRISNHEFPQLPIVATAGGTELWVLQTTHTGEPSYVKDIRYEQHLVEQGYDRKQLVQQLDEMIKEFAVTQPELGMCFAQPGLERAFLSNQPTEPPLPQFSITLHFFADSSEIFETTTRFLQTLFPSQSIVTCEDVDASRELPPDEPRRKYAAFLLPTTKAGAVRYLKSELGIARGLIAGDSGNDIDMLLHDTDFQAVLVGGAKREAVSAIDTLERLDAKGSTAAFRTVKNAEGRLIRIYVEPTKDRLGPESIARAAMILERAMNIARIRRQRLASQPTNED